MINYDLAKKYKDKGWSIFPVRLSWNETEQKFDKKPVLDHWKPYQEKLPTDEELHEWFDKPYRGANAIGMVTGKISRIVVVDHDSYKETQCSHSFSSAIVVKTISGGEQYYYRWEEEMRNDAGVSDEPVDFRADGGFVVLPGSEVNGKKYEFIKESEIMWLKPLPAEIKKILKFRKLGKIQTSLHTEQGEKADDGFANAYDGSRNNTAASVAGFLVYNIKRPLWPTIGWKSFQWWNKTHVFAEDRKTLMPLAERELLATWNSVCSRELNKNRDAPVDLPVMDGKTIANILSNDAIMNGIPTGYTVFDDATRGLRKQFTYLFAAKSKNCKSLFALNILLNIAKRKIPCAYFDLENGDVLGSIRQLQVCCAWDDDYVLSFSKNEDKEGIKKFLEDTWEQMEQDYPFYPFYTWGELAQDEEPYQKVCRMIRELVKEKNIQVVCVDNLNNFPNHQKSVTEVTYQTIVTDAFVSLANELNIAIILIHHISEKDTLNRGLKAGEFLEPGQRDTWIPSLSRLLGASQIISKTKVGMVIAHDPETSAIYGHIQTNRDGKQDVRFILLFDPKTKIISNP